MAATSPPRLLYIGIIRNDPKPVVELAFEKDLSSFSRFRANTVSEFMTFFAKQVAGSTSPGTRKDVEENEYMIHAYGTSAQITGVIISSVSYPSLVAHQLLSKIVDEFTTANPLSSYTLPDVTSRPFPQLKGYLAKYQDPNEADGIMKVQRELDETKIVLHKTIQSVLERGEKLDELVSKSGDLQRTSKMFYGQAKKQNSCCVIM